MNQGKKAQTNWGLIVKVVSIVAIILVLALLIYKGKGEMFTWLAKI